MNTSQLIQDGEKRRDEGIKHAAARQPDLVAIGRLRMMVVLLKSPSGTATIDDATLREDVLAKFPDGGMWRGQVPLSLAKDGLIEKTGEYRKTIRRSGHRRPNAVWRLTDRNRAVAFVRRAHAAMSLSANEKAPPAATGEAIKVAETDHTRRPEQ